MSLRLRVVVFNMFSLWRPPAFAFASSSFHNFALPQLKCESFEIAFFLLVCLHPSLFVALVFSSRRHGGTLGRAHMRWIFYGVVEVSGYAMLVLVLLSLFNFSSRHNSDFFDFLP